MSSMISQAAEVEVAPCFRSRARKVALVASNFSPQLSRWSQDSQERQTLLLRNICRKYAAHEQEAIRLQASQELLSQLGHLKRRLRHSLDKENIEKIMTEGPAARRQDFLTSVLREKTEMVDIGRKYSRKIRLQLTLLSEADQIAAQKGDYRHWLDQQRNSFAHSPACAHLAHAIPSANPNHTKAKPTQGTKATLRQSMDEQMLTLNRSGYVRKKRNYDATASNK